MRVRFDRMQAILTVVSLLWCGCASSAGDAAGPGGHGGHGGAQPPDAGAVDDAALDASIVSDAPASIDAGGDGGVEAGGDAPLVNGFFDVHDHGALGDGAADDTAAVSATIAAAAAAGGGIVYFPAGRYRITSGLTVPEAVTLAGIGLQPPGGGAPATLTGSWLVVDATLLHTSAITLSGAGATVRDLGIWHDQPAPGAGWTPRAFGWAVEMPSADTLVRGVWLANPTLGIRGRGRVTIENVTGQPITTGIQIDHAYDVVRLRHIRFNWTEGGGVTWSADPSVTSQLGTAIISRRDDNPQFSDVSVNGYATGFDFGADVTSSDGPAGPTAKFSLMDTTVTNAARCVRISGVNTTGKMTRFWGRNCAVTGIWIEPSGAGSSVSASDLDLREMAANAVRVEAPLAAFLANQLTVVDWNTSGSGFPALEAADPNATVKVGLYASYTGKGPQTGGVGKVAVDTDPAHTAYNLRIPTPTAVPEDGLEPFGARIDVLQHGAKGDGEADDTAAIQAALDAAAAAGGGAVVVPAGDYRVTGGLTVGSGVALVGVGWNANADKGARLSVDATNTSDVLQLGDGATVRSLGMRWDQGNVASGWQPRATFGWGVHITGTNVVVRDLFMLNPTRGIRVSSAGAGSVLLDRIFASPNQVGLQIDTQAALRVNDVHFWPFWGVCAGSPPSGCQSGTFEYFVNSPKEASGVAFQLDHSTHAELSNIFSIGYARGVVLGSNASNQVNTDLRVWNADQDIFGARGYVVSGPGTSATFANWSCQGDNGTDQAITGLFTEPSATGAQIFGYNGDLRIFAANAVRVEAPGASAVLNLMRMDAWNGSGAGFPVVEGLSGATVSVGPETWENGQ